MMMMMMMALFSLIITNLTNDTLIKSLIHFKVHICTGLKVFGFPWVYSPCHALCILSINSYVYIGLLGVVSSLITNKKHFLVLLPAFPENRNLSISAHYPTFPFYLSYFTNLY